jgi:addiction module RelE/StbE family toxin
MTYRVDFSRVEHLFRNAKKLPWEIADGLQSWAEQVEKLGLPEVRKVKRYRDHQLKGQRQGERSISLSHQWRAIYTESKAVNLQLLE